MKQEVFMGQNMVAIHMNEQEAISAAINNEKFNDNTGCLLEECIRGDEVVMKKYIDDKKLSPITILQNDFDYNNELDKAFLLNETMA